MKEGIERVVCGLWEENLGVVASLRETKPDFNPRGIGHAWYRKLFIQPHLDGRALSPTAPAGTTSTSSPINSNWGLSTINSQPLTPSDEFETNLVEQIRVLRLVLTGNGGEFCRVDVWQRNPNYQPSTLNHQPQWNLVETRVPLRLGKPLPLIPFVFHGPQHGRPDVDKGPLEDIIAANLDHYRLDADFKHGLHFTALPTAWVSGFDKAASLRIGSSTAWVTETPGATAGYLEFSGQGLTTFERAMDRDEKHMAVLGSRMLEDMKRVGETATAIELRQSGEYSILGSVAQNVSDSLTQVLRWAYWWNSTEELPDDLTESHVLVRLNTDFSTRGLASQDVQAIVAAWQSGAISLDTMHELFRRGEILPEGRTNEEELKLLEADAKRAAAQVKQTTEQVM